MTRTSNCPICGNETELLLKMHFGRKISLPTDIAIRHCEGDNFLFVANGRQSDYDEYYANVANDTCHQELSSGVHSPISQMQAQHLEKALANFFHQPRKVLDFGCGGASLLVELATHFPDSKFWGFDPGPAAAEGSARARSLALTNVTVSSLEECRREGPYDLVIASHVIEHVLDFGLLDLLHSLVTADGLLYVEVPNTLSYGKYPRLEFLYYFDRLHVNHFTPAALANLMEKHGFGYVRHFEYAFPYRDGGTYPALGVVFQKGATAKHLQSEKALGACQAYIREEQERARSNNLGAFSGLVVWGAGDNFYRSLENGGPLSAVQQMIVLDRRPQEIHIRGKAQHTVEPEMGIREHDWPVVITISEGRHEIERRVKTIDPRREILFL